MTNTRQRLRRVIKRAIFSLVPVVVLLMAAEGVVRVKYFFLHDHDWNYLTMPFRVQNIQAQDHSHYLAPEAATTPQNGPAVTRSPAAQQSSSATTADKQANYAWLRPCRDREVYSEHYHKPMPYTWD